MLRPSDISSETIGLYDNNTIWIVNEQVRIAFPAQRTNSDEFLKMENASYAKIKRDREKLSQTASFNGIKLFSILSRLPGGQYRG
jgi:hypothetical protein